MINVPEVYTRMDPAKDTRCTQMMEKGGESKYGKSTEISSHRSASTSTRRAGVRVSPSAAFLARKDDQGRITTLESLALLSLSVIFDANAVYFCGMEKAGTLVLDPRVTLVALRIVKGVPDLSYHLS